MEISRETAAILKARTEEDRYKMEKRLMEALRKGNQKQSEMFARCIERDERIIHELSGK